MTDLDVFAEQAVKLRNEAAQNEQLASLAEFANLEPQRVALLRQASTARACAAALESTIALSREVREMLGHPTPPPRPTLRRVA